MDLIQCNMSTIPDSQSLTNVQCLNCVRWVQNASVFTHQNVGERALSHPILVVCWAPHQRDPPQIPAPWRVFVDFTCSTPLEPRLLKSSLFSRFLQKLESDHNVSRVTMGWKTILPDARSLLDRVDLVVAAIKTAVSGRTFPRQIGNLLNSLRVVHVSELCEMHVREERFIINAFEQNGLCKILSLLNGMTLGDCLLVGRILLLESITASRLSWSSNESDQ